MVHYLAYDGAVVVGGGAAYLADGLAWIGFGGVIPTHRHLGYHLRLIRRRVADALKLCHTVIVDAGEGSSSVRNCLRVGFQPVASRPIYAFAKRRGRVAQILSRWLDF